MTEAENQIADDLREHLHRRVHRLINDTLALADMPEQRQRILLFFAMDAVSWFLEETWLNERHHSYSPKLVQDLLVHTLQAMQAGLHLKIQQDPGYTERFRSTVISD